MATNAADQEDKQPKRKPAANTKANNSNSKLATAPSTSATSAVPAAAATTAAAVSGGPVSADREPGLTRKMITRIALAVLALAIIVIAVFGVLIYGYRSDSPAVAAVASVIPYPAMRVGNDFVSYHEYLFELSSIKHYYTSQAAANGQPAVDFNSPQGKVQLAQLRAQIISQLKSDEVTRQLIEQNKITVSSKELNDQYNQLVKSAGGEAKLKDVLNKVYGWDVSDLKAKLKFQLASQKLQTKITNDPAAKAAALAKANDIYNQLQKGADFATLAKKYSQDTTAANGGDLGFFSRGQMVKAFEDVAFGQQPGQISKPVLTQYGYHIIKTIEFNADKTQVHAAHILIKTIDFTNYLTQKVNATKSTVYIKQ